MKEGVIRFGAGDALVGILTEPDMVPAAGPFPGFVLINAGVVHRVGPNRLYVKTARRLAALGYPVLRFDLSGIGDSRARSDAIGFEKSVVSETAEAMAVLKCRLGVEQFILAGICSGADISFLTAREHPEVVGVVLINGQSLHGVTDAAGDEIADQLKQDKNACYLWKSALLNPASWKKLVSASVNYGDLFRLVARQITDLIGSGRKPPAAAAAFQADFRAMLGRGVRLLLIYSEDDPGLNYLNIMLGRQLTALTGRDNCAKVLLRGADHTFTLMQSQEDLIRAMSEWANDRRGWLLRP